MPKNKSGYWTVQSHFSTISDVRIRTVFVRIRAVRCH